jgi:hypothetical protein
MSKQTNRGPGRPRNAQPNRKKPIVSGMVDFNEAAALEQIQAVRDRNQSYVIRLAVARLIIDDRAGLVDWAGGIPDINHANEATGQIAGG